MAKDKRSKLQEPMGSNEEAVSGNFAATAEEGIRIVYSKDKFMIVLDEAGVEMTRAEAEQLFVDLGHALQDQDILNDK